MERPQPERVDTKSGKQSGRARQRHSDREHGERKTAWRRLGVWSVGSRRMSLPENQPPPSPHDPFAKFWTFFELPDPGDRRALQSQRGCVFPHPPILTFISDHPLVVFRSGASRGYTVWKDLKCLPVISVAPIRRPKLDASGSDYSFEQEEELMMTKMRTVLRIAALHGHTDICMGAFGVGPSFRNPVSRVAAMWREVLFMEAEFRGQFTNVVFAIEKNHCSNEKNCSDFDIFQEEMQAYKILPVKA